MKLRCTLVDERWKILHCITFENVLLPLLCYAILSYLIISYLIPFNPISSHPTLFYPITFHYILHLFIIFDSIPFHSTAFLSFPYPTHPILSRIRQFSWCPQADMTNKFVVVIARQNISSFRIPRPWTIPMSFWIMLKIKHASLQLIHTIRAYSQDYRNWWPRGKGFGLLIRR